LSVHHLRNTLGKAPQSHPKQASTTFAQGQRMQRYKEVQTTNTDNCVDYTLLHIAEIIHFVFQHTNMAGMHMFMAVVDSNDIHVGV
jgi:hypothetical protein